MPINRERPMGGGTARQGNPPDEHPRILPSLLDAWYEQYLADGKDYRATATGTLLRGSDAGACSRALSYEIERRIARAHNETVLAQDSKATNLLPVIEPSNPPSIADAYRFEVGSITHLLAQDVWQKVWPGCTVEAIGTFETPALSLHADALITMVDGTKVAVELKSTGGFAMKSMAQGTKQRPPEGPRTSALLQGSLAALALDADLLVILYLGLELTSVDEAKRHGLTEAGRCGAEWSYTRGEFEPLARAELERLGVVLDVVEHGGLAPRTIPDLPAGAVVVNPANGAWVVEEDGMVLDQGETWACGYCRDRDRCTADMKEGW